MTKKEMIEKCIETDKWIHEDDCELLSETPLKLVGFVLLFITHLKLFYLFSVNIVK